MRTNQDLFNLKVFLVAAGVLGAAFLGLTWLSRGELGIGGGSSQTAEIQPEPVEPEPESPLSQGEKVFLNTSTVTLKTDGADAISAGDYEAAITAFENARMVDIADPEALVYLNNARIGESEAHSLAVIVPAESDPAAASDLLRGAAQAQTEVNQAGGIDGVPLRLVLADDQGDAELAQTIATELSQSSEVIGVLGHHSPETANAVDNIYASASLPFVSTSPSAASPSIQSLLARDLPVAKALAFYMDKLNHRTAILFYDGNSDYSLSFKSRFENALEEIGGTMTAEVDLSELPDSAPTDTPTAEIFVLSPGDSPLKTATDSIEIIPNDQVDHFYRHVFGGYELFSPEVLDLFGSMATGTILAVPDVIYQSAASPFAQHTQALWETPIDWTTAASYTVAQTVIEGLSEESTRESVQQALNNKSEAVRLIKVTINPDAPTGYDLQSVGVMANDGFKSE